MDFSPVVKEINAGLAKNFGSNLPQAFLQLPPGHVKAHASIAWPLSAAKILKKPPLEIAKEAAEIISGIKAVSSAGATPPGFVNLEFSDGALLESLAGAAKSPDGFICAGEPRGATLLEFVSANPTGPLHVASGRGAALGDSLARILRALGHKVSCEYYVNDAGNQASLLGLSLKARHEGKEPPEEGYHGDYLKTLAAELPPEAAAWSAEKFSAFAVEKLVSGHQADMEGFRASFDRWYRESELHAGNLAQSALSELRRRGMVYEKDGAVWFGSTADDADDKDRVLVRSDGRPTYFLNDIAYHKNKYDRGFGNLVDIWGADHHGYVPRMKAAMSALGYPPDSFCVIIHQMVLLRSGGQQVKMSKRAGEFITLRELVSDVGADACRFFFASRTPDSHLTFDLDLAKKQTQENPVYYAQYVHARICSIFRKAGEKTAAPDFSAGLCAEERALAAKLAWFDETLKLCVRDLSPHHLANYLLDLAGTFHQFYDNCRVLDETDSAATNRRLYLCSAVKNTMKKGLELIGVSAPEEM